ncbi:ribonuclease III domain-containing protein [Boeremia exigua]|uniref:ribonuclease III domain-containing protein n=1 Tax=Boeremia exigua TaxID=749465 RepID=UPI001E8D0173|nr:ribonuclease III domain-containing protein [Boeremia exigua]KAH6622219.1 ribonuclease III domain-containing protein [Boeremia exigua]
MLKPVFLLVIQNRVLGVQRSQLSNRSYPGRVYGNRDRDIRHGHPQQRSHGHQQPRSGNTTAFQGELSKAEMQTGLVALLDRFVADETRSDADRDILHHASELRRLLARKENPSSATSQRELDKKRPETAPKVAVPPYIHRKVQEAKDLPGLPPIDEPHIHDAVFTHRSYIVRNGDKNAFTDLELDYERLEFLGDAYIELIASHALYSRFPHVDVPQLCSWRERLVENSMLGKFSEAYGFPDRLRHHNQWDHNSKAWKKVIADIFEAYVAGIVLADPEHGYEIADKWLTELWAPQLLSFKEKIVEDSQAKNKLAALVVVNDIKLEYREERPMIYEQGSNLQKYFMGVYLTGWGYQSEWLGSGEGQNKASASLSAAADAIRKNSDVTQDAAKQKAELVSKRREEKAKAEAEAAAKAAEEGTVESGAQAVGEDGNKSKEKKRDRDAAELNESSKKKHKKDRKDH